MTNTLTGADLASISSLLILLVGALSILLLETFDAAASKKWSFWVACLTIGAGLGAAILSPSSHNPLLTSWIRFDPLAHFFTYFFLLIGQAAALLSFSFFRRFDAGIGEYFFLLLSALFGLILIGISADFLSLFLGLETLSISLYVLCAYMKKWELSHEAAMKYFFMSSLAAAFLLYGIALIYGALGTTDFEVLLPGFQALTSRPDKILFLSGIFLVTFGLAFKAAIVPFHLWAPDVYDGAPTPVTAFMAVGTKAGAFAAFVRVFFDALPHFNPLWNQGVALLAYPTLIYANFVALRQLQLRRFFAYSGIAHAGFLLIPLAVGTPEALQALLFYFIVYGLATLGCFAVIAFLDHRKEGVMIHDLRGLFRRDPYLSGVLTLCLLTLAGIPPTAGFFAKFYLFKLAFEAGYILLVVVALLTSILAAFYYTRLITVMLSEAPEEADIPPSSPAAIVGTLCFAALILLSIFPSPLMALLVAK